MRWLLTGETPGTWVGSGVSPKFPGDDRQAGTSVVIGSGVSVDLACAGTNITLCPAGNQPMALYSHWILQEG